MRDEEEIEASLRAEMRVECEEIYCASDPERRLSEPVTLRAPFVMYAWWGSFFVARGLNRVAWRMDQDTIPQILAAVRFGFIADGAHNPAKVWR